MGTLLLVKQATIEHLDALTDLFDEYRVFYQQESDREGAKKFLFDRFVNRESILFLVTDGENSIGFTQLYPSFSSISMQRSWILNDLYVRDEYRNRGAAKLLEAAKTYAIQTEAKGLGLSTAISNVTAQRLYERNGYKMDTDFYHYYLSL